MQYFSWDFKYSFSEICGETFFNKYIYKRNRFSVKKSQFIRRPTVIRQFDWFFKYAAREVNS
jgi:hypothetical protein